MIMLYDDLLVELGLKVKYYRMRKKLSQAMLAELINVEEHRISNIECGKCNLTLKTLNKLASALNVSLNSLFNFNE